MFEDVDLIIKNRSLCEIDEDVKYTKIRLDWALDGANEMIIGYWTGRLMMLEHARDLAEFCIDNDIPTNDTFPSKPTPKDYRVVEILDTIKQMDYDIKGLKKRIPPRAKGDFV